MSLVDLFAPEGLELAAEVYQALLRGDPIGPVQRTVLRTKGRGPATVETCTARTTYQGHPAIIGYCRDVTGHARMEDTLERQAQALSEKNKALEEAIRRLREARDDLFEQQKLAELGTFSAGIAHEIRNPLGLVRSHLLRLQEARDDAAREASIRGIDRQIRRTSDFIEKILSYARPTLPVRRRLDLNRTLSMAARFAAQAFPIPAGVEIRREFDPDLPRILGDHTQLQEVFINIVNNAIQAVGTAGTIRLVTACEGEGAVRAEVIDTGPGVPEPLREQIFLPFFTAGKGSKGTGMGLAIARRIVEGHEGRIEVVPPPGGGACFRVVLPPGAGAE
jgi:signal transduction histidine kinase